MGSKPTWVMGVDPGVNKAGIALLEIHTEKLVTIALPRAEDRFNTIFERYFTFCGELQSVATIYQPVFGIIEYPANAFHNIDVFEMVGLFRGAMVYFGDCCLVFASTTSARKCLTGHGSPDKALFLRDFEEMVPEAWWEGKSDDEREAVGFAMLASDVYRKVMLLKRTQYCREYPEEFIEKARFALGLTNKKPKAQKKGKRLIV